MATDEKPCFQRFADIGSLSKRMLAPIEGYEDEPLVSLEEAVRPLVKIVPKIERNVDLVKENCRTPKDGLTTDESAAIMLYTFESMPRKNSLYIILNDTLRAENRKQLIPWFLFLKLILTALAKLPSLERHVFRGVRGDFRKEYPNKSEFIWWAFSSCTTTVDVLENEEFFGSSGHRTLFSIQCTTGKDIKNHSFVPTENKVLLMPARKFIVTGALDSGNGLYMIQVEEIQSKILIIEIPKVMPSPAIVPKKQPSMLFALLLPIDSTLSETRLSLTKTT